MDEANKVSHPDASAIVPVKRKRGRPRKYPKPETDHGGNVHVPRDQNLNHGENARAPAGFGGVNGNQPRQVDPVNDANDAMVGQVVSGVIEAVFDAGYLLTVRVGDSETTLRGVVFKPGHYVPVSADNDVAPGIQMIRRNEIPLPRENYAQAHGHNSQSRDRNGVTHAARSSNLVATKGKQVSSIVPQNPPGISRGNLVPVVLQPVSLSNGSLAAGESSVTTQATHPMPSKVKEVLDATTHPPNGSTPTNQVLNSQSQNNHQVIPSGTQSETAPVNKNPAEAAHEADAKFVKLPGMQFEKLLTEVIKRTQVPSDLTEADSSKAGKLSVNDSGVAEEDDVSETDQALSVEPLQVVGPDLQSHPEVVSRPMENYRTGKMTELLQVLQENIENQATQADELRAASRQKLDDPRDLEAKLEDEDSDQTKKRARTSSV